MAVIEKEKKNENTTGKHPVVTSQVVTNQVVTIQ